MTSRERELLDFITTYIRVHRYSPSYDEMMVALVIKSKSDISRLERQLADKGHIIFTPNRARAIEMPTSQSAIDQAWRAGYNAGVAACKHERKREVVEA